MSSAEKFTQNSKHQMTGYMRFLPWLCQIHYHQAVLAEVWVERYLLVPLLKP